MDKKWIAALLAAASILPTAAIAQDRGGDRGGPRGDRAQGRQMPAGGNWQRPSMPRPQAPQAAPQRVAPMPSNRAAVRQQFRQERRDDRGAFAAERQRDRQALAAGQVTREQFRTDRTRDRAEYQRDRAQDRAQFRPDGARQPQWNGQPQRDGRAWNGQPRPGQPQWNGNGQPQRGVDRQRDDDRRWARSGADWNDQRRLQEHNARWQDYRQYDRNRGYNDRGHNGWNRDWRRDTRYDWNRWRTSNRNTFRLPRYYAPYGWNSGYRRFGIGATLSTVLFAQNYWIDDPWSYRLPEAYEPYRWVRYYNDALLVDTYSGEVVDVIHDIFW